MGRNDVTGTYTFLVDGATSPRVISSATTDAEFENIFIADIGLHHAS